MIERVRTLAARLTGDYRYPKAPRIPPNYRTNAGVVITPDLAQKNAVVWACTRFLSQGIGGLPVLVLQPNTGPARNGVSQSLPITHAIGDLLGNRPSVEWSAFRFRETMVRWALLWGNGYAEIEFDLAGRAIGLWPIHPERVMPLRDENGVMFYRVYNGAGYGSKLAWVDMPAKSIFHLAGFGDSPVGVNVVEYAAQSIGWAQAAELFGASFFGDGMTLGGVVQMKGRGDPDSITRMRSEMEGRHAKSRGGRWFRWAFLDNDATVTKMTAAPNEGQFVETLTYQVPQICRWFGVPPHKVADLTKGTFANVEQQNIEVVGDSILPWAIRFEQEATFKLFGANRQDLYVKLDLKGLLRGDFQTRQQGLEVMRRNGVISANDWARLEDQPILPPDAGGDIYAVSNIWTLQSQIGAMPVGRPPADPPTEAMLSPGARAAADAMLRELERLQRPSRRA